MNIWMFQSPGFVDAAAIKWFVHPKNKQTNKQIVAKIHKAFTDDTAKKLTFAIGSTVL